MNATGAIRAALVGKGVADQKDVIIGWATVVLCCLQLLLGTLTLWLLKKVNIFHNSFGFLCAAKMTFDMLSSAVHVGYSGPITISQSTAVSPYFGIAAGFFGYFLAAVACSLHVLLSLNRFTAVYFPLSYQIVFSLRNCRRVLFVAIIACIILVIPYYAVPCNILAYSARYIGYVVLDCDDGVRQRPFRVGTFVHYACLILFCGGAIFVDALTLIKILKLKRIKSNEKNSAFNRNVRFFAQSACQNIPMFSEVLMMAFGDNELTPDKAVFRILSFMLTRLTDVICSTTLVLFNPEARKFVMKSLRERHLVSFTESSSNAQQPATSVSQRRTTNLTTRAH